MCLFYSKICQTESQENYRFSKIMQNVYLTAHFVKITDSFKNITDLTSEKSVNCLFYEQKLIKYKKVVIATNIGIVFSKRNNFL